MLGNVTGQQLCFVPLLHQSAHESNFRKQWNTRCRVLILPWLQSPSAPVRLCGEAPREGDFSQQICHRQSSTEILLRGPRWNPDLASVSLGTKECHMGNGKKSDLAVVPSLLEFHSACAAPPTVTPEQGLHIGKTLGSHEGGEKIGAGTGERFRGEG